MNLGQSYRPSIVCLRVHTQSLSRVQLSAAHGKFLTGPSVHGISQARILEWVAISFYRGSSQPRDQTRISAISLPLSYLGNPDTVSYVKLIH